MSGCEWFALCPNDADGYVSHPIIGTVPTCKRCADKLGLTFIRQTVSEAHGELIEAQLDGDAERIAAAHAALQTALRRAPTKGNPTT